MHDDTYTYNMQKIAAAPLFFKLIGAAAKGIGKATNWGAKALVNKTPATLRMGTAKAVQNVQTARQGLQAAKQTAIQNAQALRQAKSQMRNYGPQSGRWYNASQAQANYNTAKGLYDKADTAYNASRKALADNITMNKTIAGIPNAMRGVARTGITGMAGYGAYKMFGGGTSTDSPANTQTVSNTQQTQEQPKPWWHIYK